MTRRTFIKGVVAVGIAVLTPLRAITAKPYMTATEVLRKNKEYEMKYAQEFIRGMSRTFSNQLMYGRSYAGNSLNATKVLTGLMKQT